MLHLTEFQKISGEHGIQNTTEFLPYSFSALITGLAKKYNEQVVVLIDEYDKPITEHLGKGKSALSVAKENRDVLKSFFGVMKGGDVSASLRFVFITGISKFARVSIFSDLNNLNDISMNRKYATLLGYTEEELVSFFSECISQLAHETETHSTELVRKIRRWYDGYRFTALEKRVYNPFSVVRLFDAGEFENFWFETATPSFLVNLIKEKKYPVLEIESLKLPRELFSIYDPETLQIEPLLFQTGYITIRNYENELWHMEYPNQEVRVSFLSYLLNDFARVENVRLLGAYKLLNMYLREKRADEFIQTVQAILASVPYVHIANQDEAYYHTVFYLMLAASGVDVRTEVLTSQGRIDLTLESDEMAVIAELKCNSSSKKAIQQILEKKYYEKYLNDQREIYLLGINFNTEKRTIDDWQWGELKKFLKVPSDQKQKGKRKKSGSSIRKFCVNPGAFCTSIEKKLTEVTVMFSIFARDILSNTDGFSLARTGDRSKLRQKNAASETLNNFFIIFPLLFELLSILISCLFTLCQTYDSSAVTVRDIFPGDSADQNFIAFLFY